MASVGPQDPTAAANDASIGVSWGTTGNVYVSDNSRSQATLFGLGTTHTKKLFVTGFDFSAIPSGATIDGIVVEVERSASSTSGSPRDTDIYLTKDGSSTVGANKASGSTWPTTDAYTTYGGAADLWSTTWTDTEVKASTFGMVIRANRNSAKGSATVRIDHIRITVHYTAGGVSGSAWNYYAQQ